MNSISFLDLSLQSFSPAASNHAPQMLSSMSLAVQALTVDGQADLMPKSYLARAVLEVNAETDIKQGFCEACGLNSAKTPDFKQANIYFDRVINDVGVSATLKEKARFYKAKAQLQEGPSNTQQVIETFVDLVSKGKADAQTEIEALEKLIKIYYKGYGLSGPDYKAVRKWLPVLMLKITENKAKCGLYALLLAKMDSRGQGLEAPDFAAAIKNLTTSLQLLDPNERLAADAHYMLGVILCAGRDKKILNYEAGYQHFLAVLKNKKTDPKDVIQTAVKIAFLNVCGYIKNGLSLLQIRQMFAEPLASANETYRAAAKLGLLKIDYIEKRCFFPYELRSPSSFKEPRAFCKHLEEIYVKASIELGEKERYGTPHIPVDAKSARQRFTNVLINEYAFAAEVSKARFYLADMDFSGEGLSQPAYLDAQAGYKFICFDPDATDEHKQAAELQLDYLEQALKANADDPEVIGMHFLFPELPTLFDIKKAMQAELSVYSFF